MTVTAIIALTVTLASKRRACIKPGKSGHDLYSCGRAIILHEAGIKGVAVVVGAIVHGGTVLPRNSFLPPNMIAIGDPAKTYAPGDPELPQAIKQIGFARRAFGVEANWEDQMRRYRQVTEVRSRALAVVARDVRTRLNHLLRDNKYIGEIGGFAGGATRKKFLLWLSR